MKILNVVGLLLFLLSSPCFANDEDKILGEGASNKESFSTVMDTDSITEAEEVSKPEKHETRERYEYNFEASPYVKFNYTATRVII